MTGIGETIATGASPKCCGKTLELQILQSGAGLYIGTFCPNCGPYSRESGYYRKWKDAKDAFDSGEFGRI